MNPKPLDGKNTRIEFLYEEYGRLSLQLSRAKEDHSVVHGELLALLLNFYRDHSDSTPTSERDRALGGCRPEVVAFAHAMEAQLRANDHKPGWKKDNSGALISRVREEYMELAEVLSCRTEAVPLTDKVLKEAADVANFAMMIADVCGSLRSTPAPEPPSIGFARANAHEWADLAEELYNLACNSSGGDHEKESDEWRGCFERLRERYFRFLKCAPAPEPTQKPAPPLDDEAYRRPEETALVEKVAKACRAGYNTQREATKQQSWCDAARAAIAAMREAGFVRSGEARLNAECADALGDVLKRAEAAERKLALAVEGLRWLHVNGGTETTRDYAHVVLTRIEVAGEGTTSADGGEIGRAPNPVLPSPALSSRQRAEKAIEDSRKPGTWEEIAAGEGGVVERPVGTGNAGMATSSALPPALVEAIKATDSDIYYWHDDYGDEYDSHARVIHAERAAWRNALVEKDKEIERLKSEIERLQGR